MSRNLPRILLLADASLEQEGVGLNRTLVNLFQLYPREKLLLFAPADLLERSEGQRIAAEQAGFKRYYCAPLRNRAGKVINPFISQVNAAACAAISPELGAIHGFHPELLLICPNSLESMLIARKLQRKLECPSIVYAMDDWVHGAAAPGLRPIQDWAARRLLSKADGWLMISEELREVFTSAYAISAPPYHIVHNPVRIEPVEVPPPPSNSDFQITYAGSIWPMHFDALAALAKSVKILRDEKTAIKLVLHTAQNFWDSHAPFWIENEVSYGGNIPYTSLRSALYDANLLAVVSSFDPAYRFLSDTSLQTKVTDYMASGRPLLSFGPEQCVCSRFVEKWQCGFSWAINDHRQTADFLRGIIQDQAQLSERGKRAFQVAKEHFEMSAVSEKLYSFIGARCEA